MRKITAKEMKKIDIAAQTRFGIPGLVLMENAGLRAAEYALAMLKPARLTQVLVLCGPGNNGGDGFVLARHLINRGVRVKIRVFTDSLHIKGDALINFNILKKFKADIKPVKKGSGLSREIRESGLIVDAIFGIGLNKEIQGLYREVILLINKSSKKILSLDVPSGLCATTGKIFGVCIKASATVTFGLDKKGFYCGQGAGYRGKVIVADISLPRALVNKKKV